jgi:hypothetical protein
MRDLELKQARDRVLRAALVFAIGATFVYVLRPPLPIISGGDIEPLAMGGAIVVVTIGYVLFPLLAITAIVLLAAALTLVTVQLMRSMTAGVPRN